MRGIFGFVVAIVLLVISPAFADFSGPVVSVLDGDTIEVLHHQHPERIRLSGIYCPEKDQAFGTRVKDCAGMAQVLVAIEAEHAKPQSAPMQQAA